MHPVHVVTHSHTARIPKQQYNESAISVTEMFSALETEKIVYFKLLFCFQPRFRGLRAFRK